MGKVIPLLEAVRTAGALRKRGKRIVTTNGCFDILHVGHVRCLAGAKKLGDVLFVGVNTDSRVRKSKGRGRPVVPAKQRAEMLAALAPVDYVFIFPHRTPAPWLRQIRPHVHVKGAAPHVHTHPDYVTDKKAVEAAGGRVAFVTDTSGTSTSAILRKIKGSR